MQSEIDIKRFKKLQRISKGGFGVVYKIEEKKTGEIYAAKIIDCDDNKEKSNEMINRELDILIHSKHPTIIKFIGYSRIDFHDESNVTIIMEFAKNGSLRDVLQKIQQNFGPKNYTNTSRQIILVGVSRGMKYLHDRNIIHRDVKPENILLDDNFQPHITDFGLSKFYDIGHSRSQTMFGGTLSYKAPEILKKMKYDAKVDVYSFAILMFEVLTDSVPYPEIDQISEYDFMRKIIDNNYRPKFNVPIKDSLRILIEKCWSNNPDERPSFDEIFNKLSNKDSDDNEYLLDDVDIDELNMYVEDITQVTDCTEQLLSKISDLELDNKKLQIEISKLKSEDKSHLDENKALKLDNKQLQMEINKLKSENKSYLDENKTLKLDNKKLQIEINRLKSENKNHLDANKALEVENEQLRKEIYKLKSENVKQSDANKDIKKEKSKIKPKSDESKQSDMKIKQTKNDYDQTKSFSFTIYNEKCIWENCKNGITSVINKKYCINVIVDQESNAEVLYQAVSNQMKININCLRLWVISNNGTTFKYVFKRETKLDSIRIQNLFAQIKDEKEKLELDYGTNVFFLLLYTPNRVKPFFFIQSKKYETTLLKYNKIMEDAVSVLSSNIASKINIKYVNIYIINKQTLQQKQDFNTVYADSGTIMIIQIDDPRVNIDDSSLSGLKKKIKKDCYFDNIPAHEEIETDTPISFIDYMQNSHPKDVTEYFELRNDVRKARIYNYSDISQYKGTIEFPKNVKQSKLTEFIKIAFDIKFDDEKDTLLLFGCEDNTNIPKSKPFNIGTKSIYMDNLERIYYCISSKTAANDYTSETRVIQLSKDAFSIAKVVCYYMQQSEIYPIQMFKVLNYSFLGDNTRMFVVEQNNCAGPIIKDTQEDGFEINNKNKLRIEIIPDDQINKELILLYKTYVDGNRFQPFEQPFYFSYVPDEPVVSFKKRVFTFLNLKKDFKVHKKALSYSDSYLVKDKINFKRYDKERTLFLIYDTD